MVKNKIIKNQLLLAIIQNNIVQMKKKTSKTNHASTLSGKTCIPNLNQIG